MIRTANDFDWRVRGARNVIVELHHEGKEVGSIILARADEHRMRPACRKDVEALRAGTSLVVWDVRQVDLQDHLHGKGLGMQLYLRGIQALYLREGEVILVPNSCSTAGSTGDKAQRVWDRLGRYFKQHGSAILIDSTPSLKRMASSVASKWRSQRDLNPRLRRDKPLF